MLIEDIDKTVQRPPLYRVLVILQGIAIYAIVHIWEDKLSMFGEQTFYTGGVSWVWNSQGARWSRYSRLLEYIFTLRSQY